MTEMPAAPLRSFASDNAAGAHPRVLEAMIAANDGHALAYGADRWTAAAEGRLGELFGNGAQALLVWNGTGANVMALATMLRPAEAVVCTVWSHIAVDETGAPERILGAKLMDLPSPDAKLVPAQLDEVAGLLGSQHAAQPGVVSITQSTELGTLYTADEVAAICETAHRHGMLVHLDGARLANATAALGGDVHALRSFTVDAGVDVVSFGATKAGAAFGEAVVYLRSELAQRARYVRKQVTQLPSKMRFVAAQIDALVEGDLWLDLARHANRQMGRLHAAVAGLPGLVLEHPPVVNSMFPCLPRTAIDRLQAWTTFYDWDASRNQVRWMTAWDTADEDVDRFAAGVRAVLG